MTHALHIVASALGCIPDGPSLGGRLERDEVRVASLGGQRGTGMGRAEWERVYYPGWR